MVRRAARSRPRAAGVHRRDLDGHQYDPQPRPLPTGRAAADGLSAWPSQDDDAGRWLAHDRHGRADGAGWPDQRRLVRGLCRPSARARPQARRHCHHGQPVQPQARQHPRPDRGGRRPPHVPPAPGLRRGRLYSPDFNPIEKAVARLKAMRDRMRAKGKAPKTILIAVARQLLVILNAMIRKRQPIALA